MTASRRHHHAHWVLVLALLAPLTLGCSPEQSATPNAHLVHQPGQRRPGDAGREVRRRVGRRLQDRDPDPAQRGRRSSASSSSAGSPPRISSIDLMSLDPPFVAEFANAGFLLPVTDPADVDDAHRRASSTPRSKTAYWNGQAGRRRRSGPTPSCCGTASRSPQAAGVDPTSPDFTWDEMIKAAEAQGKRIGVQGRRYEGYMVWINALVASARRADHRATPSSAPGRHPDDRLAGRRRWPPTIVGELARSAGRAAGDVDRRRGGGPLGCSRATTASFMVNWPYVYSAAKEAVAESGAIDQSRRRRHRLGPLPGGRRPARRASRRSAASTSAIGAFTKHPDAGPGGGRSASPRSRATSQYMVDSGNPAARAAAYDDPEVREAFPMADLIRESINDAGPRPDHAVLRRRLHVGAAHLAPAGRACDAPQTPEETDDLHVATCCRGSGCCELTATITGGRRP